jgi:hypothetical protein
MKQSPIVTDTLQLMEKAKSCKTHEARMRAKRKIELNYEVMTAAGKRELAAAIEKESEK